MEFGLQTAGDYDLVLGAARWVEAKGLAAFALPDHYIMAFEPEDYGEPVYDMLTQLGGLARDTSSIELVVLVSPVTFRHPAVIAKMALTIDDMSGGRFVLGVGTGWQEAEHRLFGLPFPARTERFLMLEEALGYVAAVFRDPGGGFDGDHYRFEGFEARPLARSDMRLLVGGGGALRTPRLAGRFAGEFNLRPGTDMAERIEVARQAAAAAGREPDDLLLTSYGPVIGAADEAGVREYVAEMAADRGVDTEEFESRIGKLGLPIGTWDRYAEWFDSLVDLGVGRYYIQDFPPNYERLEEMLAALE